ncbi:MAG: LssY C-terminal domain-containing protein [Luteococcus sp.]|uniref:LssY C-terminal domain-containing protein n=1 Tax=Luteococcus sp. TaxID=1969402 RepID=UPI0026481D78|nr:LssY C-terminal domain-containing protein [Luteococcus sp.]MDN5562589.1 LssY C-terminal domain-containing protein [Luteococcus sp.]
MSSPRYPVPPAPPVYRHAPDKVSARRTFAVFELLAAAFVVVALALAFWLAAILLTTGFSGHRVRLMHLVLFWATTAYLALPRVHQLFTLLYLPDYFIGRTRTADGLLGDPINLGLDGNEHDVHAAMRAAGWTRADDLSVRSAWGMIRSSVLRRSYPAAPVSGLFLFQRRQDFAYQQEVDGNPARRHHVRFWRVPHGWLLPGGQPVTWLAAATYDRAVGFSMFTWQITHKIDENIDIERDYLIDTVRYADPETTVHVIKDFSTAYHHRNGGGDRVRTDGDLPILDVGGALMRVEPEEKIAARSYRYPGFTRHGVPPAALWITGGLVAGRALLVAAAWGFVGLRDLLGPVLGAGMSDLRASTLVALAAVVLWWLIVARKRLAWVLLMVVAVVDAVNLLAGITASGATGLGSLTAAGLAVLTVLASSASPVRDWVSRGRREPEVTIPEPTWRHLRERG